MGEINGLKWIKFHRRSKKEPSTEINKYTCAKRYQSAHVSDESDTVCLYTCLDGSISLPVMVLVNLSSSKAGCEYAVERYEMSSQRE